MSQVLSPSSSKDLSESHAQQEKYAQRLLVQLNISLSALNNSLHELLALPPITAFRFLNEQKGGLGQFAESVRSTRMVINNFFETLGIDETALEIKDKKYTSRSHSAKVMLSKLRSGMTGCRNAISHLLREDSRKNFKTDKGKMILSELRKVNGLLKVFESENKEIIETFLRKFQSRNNDLVASIFGDNKPKKKSKKVIETLSDKVEKNKVISENDLRYAIARELARRDGEGIKFHDLYLFLKREKQGNTAISKNDLERELKLLKGIFNKMGIKLRGVLRRRGTKPIRILPAKS